MKTLQTSILFISLLGLLFQSCENKKKEEVKEKKTLKEGFWRATLELRGHELPFNFEVKKKGGNYNVFLLNNDERLLLDEVIIKDDSLEIPMSVFDASIIAKISGDKLTGSFTRNYSENYFIPFEATFGQQHRFEEKPKATTDFSGQWVIKFDTEADKAIGKFQQTGNKITGTIMTTTGDYRYLEGSVSENKLFLSTFDGSHAFLFEAALLDSGELKGEFWSGSHHYENWIATKDENYQLPDANSLTLLKKGYDKLAFEFPNLEGKMVSLTDEKYKGKVVIVQLYGTWCPNCMDETRFYANWYEKNKSKGVEIIALAFEQKDDFNYASKRVSKMKRKLNANYDFLIAGTSDKEDAAKKLPMLNHVMSFPTSIFIDKKGIVRRIHTGFSGPGTGKYYDEFVEDFNHFTEKLLAE